MPPVPVESILQEEEDNADDDNNDGLGVVFRERDSEQSDSSQLFSSCSPPSPGPYTMPSQPLSQSFECSQRARLYSQDFLPTAVAFPPSFASRFLLEQQYTDTPSFLREHGGRSSRQVVVAICCCSCFPMLM